MTSVQTRLIEDITELIAAGVDHFGIIGEWEYAQPIVTWMRTHAPAATLDLYGVRGAAVSGVRILEQSELLSRRPSVVVVAADAHKEDVITDCLRFLDYVPRLLVAGYRHYEYQNERFHKLRAGLLVPSIANGYPNTLIHLYECLVNAARLGAQGSVVEFGTFRGGTSMFLAKTIGELGQRWPVLTFDTFDGFPSRRSALDMYDHPGAEYRDEDSVRRYLGTAGVELVVGDLVETAGLIAERPIVLAFVDTDNYSSASAALDAIQDHIVVGGAIVFDHFTGVDRFRYTLGERMAARRLLDDARFFNLHATGVFYRQT